MAGSPFEDRYQPSWTHPRAIQTNRGFPIVSVDPAGKRATFRQVADTGLTSTGGDDDGFEDATFHLCDLKQEKKYDRA